MGVFMAKNKQTNKSNDWGNRRRRHSRTFISNVLTTSLSTTSSSSILSICIYGQRITWVAYLMKHFQHAFSPYSIELIGNKLNYIELLGRIPTNKTKAFMETSHRRNRATDSVRNANFFERGMEWNLCKFNRKLTLQKTKTETSIENRTRNIQIHVSAQ